MRALISSISRTFIMSALFFTMVNRLDIIEQNSNQINNDYVTSRLICYHVMPEYQVIFRKAITDYILYSINVESNILSEAYNEKDSPSVFWIIERWNNKSTLEKISNSLEFQTIDSLSKIGTLQPATFIYLNDLEPLSKKQWRQWPQKQDKPVTIMLFVDSKKGTEDIFKELYHAAIPQFRSEEGVINYQISQFEADRTRFVTYEKFRNEDAFQFHLKFQPINPVLDYLNTSIKEQPFQIGLHRLVEFAPLIRK